MEIREAFWEKRNLDLDTLEIDFEVIDEYNNDLANMLSRYKHIVAKTPGGDIKLLHRLENEGFRFMETQICFSKKLDLNYKTPENFKRVSERISAKPVMTELELDSILNEINKGVFETDRIALDMFFGIESAARRYRNWITDEFKNNNSRLFELVFGKNNIGFFLIKNINEVKASIVLGGIYNAYKNFGLGFSFIEKAIEISLSEGKTSLIAKVSSNNLPILKLYSVFGFSIFDVSYVLRRIIE